MKESAFERVLKTTIETEILPGSFVLKMYPGYIQGFPDRLVIYKDFWGAFEVKRARNSSVQPNQRYYIDLLNQMSFGRFVHPGNEEGFYNELQRAYESLR